MIIHDVHAFYAAVIKWITHYDICYMYVNIYVYVYSYSVVNTNATGTSCIKHKLKKNSHFISSYSTLLLLTTEQCIWIHVEYISLTIGLVNPGLGGGTQLNSIQLFLLKPPLISSVLGPTSSDIILIFSL